MAGTDKARLQRHMSAHVNNAMFITQCQLCDFIGCSRQTVKRKLAGVASVDGKYYFIPDVVDVIFQKMG